MIRLPALLTAAAIASVLPAEAAQRDFAGSWSVLVITTKGDCDRAYRYQVDVSPTGAISYAGQGSFTASGQVAADGGVDVTIARGEQSAKAAGRLSAAVGSGTWNSPNGNCSGRWRAERKG
jgi:hypothetical protein